MEVSEGSEISGGNWGGLVAENFEDHEKDVDVCSVEFAEDAEGGEKSVRSEDGGRFEKFERWRWPAVLSDFFADDVPGIFVLRP